MRKATQIYLYSAACILLMTSLAKIYSTAGTAKILGLPEALLPATNRQTLWFVGLIELVMVFVLLLCKNETIKLTCIAWLGCNFVLYRLGVMLLTVGKPCPCLGSITEMLPLKPATIDRILSVVVAYLLFGSLLFLLARKRKARSRVPTGTEATAVISNISNQHAERGLLG